MKEIRLELVYFTRIKYVSSTSITRLFKIMHVACKRELWKKLSIYTILVLRVKDIEFTVLLVYCYAIDMYMQQL